LTPGFEKSHTPVEKIIFNRAVLVGLHALRIGRGIRLVRVIHMLT
jgi:hypothetical protein